MSFLPRKWRCQEGAFCFVRCEGCPGPDAERYPYRHHGEAVHGSKLEDYLISEASLREDQPELFEDETS